MSIAPDLQSWTLSNQAAGLMEATGVSLAEVYRVLSQPQESRAGIVPGQRELRGYGLLVTVFRQEIRFVALDGANSLTWEQHAIERALSDQGDVLGGCSASDHSRSAAAPVAAEAASGQERSGPGHDACPGPGSPEPTRQYHSVGGW
jgi:hypothetical protein